MEIKKLSSTKQSDHEKPSTKERESILFGTRKRLLEQALTKENISSTLKPSGIQEKPSTTSKQPNPICKPSQLQTQASKKPVENKLIESRLSRSKSPTCTKRNNSLDLSKNPNLAKYRREKSTGRLRPTTANNQATKKAEKSNENIIKIVAQFSIKKINVIQNQDLKESFCKEDEDLCRSFIALLSDTDYHIKESSCFSIEVFRDYISSPGIVAQTIKRIPQLIKGDKILQSKIYSENINLSFEIFNKIDSLTDLPSFVLLAGLMESIFQYKDFQCKKIKFVKPTKNLEKTSPAEKKASGTNTRKSHTKTGSLNTPLTITITHEESFVDNPLEKSENNIILNQSYEFSKEQTNSFRDSKKFLLEKFFTKMNLPLKDNHSPLKDETNKFTANLEKIEESTYFIKIKQNHRSSSTTPRTDSVKVDKPASGDFKGIKPSSTKSKLDDLKRKNIMVGSRFYKKIDEKFIEILLEKMKKDPKEFSKLKICNFEDFNRKKTEYITLNKAIWVKETIKLLQNPNILLKNENDSLFDTKNEALFEYLSQEKNISVLVSKCEQQEIILRKL